MFVSRSSLLTRLKYLIANKSLFLLPFSTSSALCPPHAAKYSDLRATQQGLYSSSECTNNSDVILRTKLIREHFQAGRTDEARKVFDEMPERNVVTYSTIIYGYSCNGLFRDAMGLFQDMLRSGISPNSFSLVAVLVGAAGLGTSQLTEVLHARIVKTGFGSSSFLRSALLDCYAKCHEPKKSFALLSEFRQPDLVSCNAMLSGFVYNSLFEEALLLYKQIRATGFDPQPTTMTSVLGSCAGYGSFSLCESVHGYTIKIGLDLDVYVSNLVFKMYMSFGKGDIVNQAFKLLSVKDVVTWTALMGFLLEQGQNLDVLDLFVRMRRNGIVPDRVSMLKLVRACALLGNVKLCKLVHGYITVQGLGFELSVVNSLISMYFKCGDATFANNLFDLVQEKNSVTWTCMISGYMQNEFPIKGMKLFHELRRQNTFTMDKATTVTLLAICGNIVDFQLTKQFHAYSLKLGIYDQFLPVKNALIAAYGKCGCIEFSCKIFEEIPNRNVVSWNSMILSHGINGEGNKAVDLFINMTNLGCEPDNITYLNTLTACSHNGLVNEGLTVLKRMLMDKGVSRPVDLGEEHLTCVVDLLSRAGYVEQARNLINHFREKGTVNTWKALLGGLLFHNNRQVMKEVGREILQKDMGDSANLVLVSNAYAAVGKFESVENLRPPSSSSYVKNVGLSYVDYGSF